jgi:hypothetical protein
MNLLRVKKPFLLGTLFVFMLFAAIQGAKSARGSLRVHFGENKIALEAVPEIVLDGVNSWLRIQTVSVDMLPEGAVKMLTDIFGCAFLEAFVHTQDRRDLEQLISDQLVHSNDEILRLLAEVPFSIDCVRDAKKIEIFAIRAHKMLRQELLGGRWGAQPKREDYYEDSPAFNLRFLCMSPAVFSGCKIILNCFASAAGVFNN